MNPYMILPRLNTPAANGPVDAAISVYVYKAVNGIAESVANAVGAVRTWNARHAAVRDLSRLDDHLLKDIGIHRSEIRAAVNGMLSRPPARSDRLSPTVHVAAADRARPAANDNEYTKAA